MGHVEEEMVREGLRASLAASVFVSLVLSSGCAGAPSSVGRERPPEEPPAAPREFRAAWVASVANIDWPSKPGLTTQEQRAEIVRIVELAKELRLNALIVQVRTSADALYPSSIEPWSEYLSGEQGKAPEPFYDPLRTWIDEAHARGIELHAWFNPYRARHNEAKSTLSAQHISRTHPSVVKPYGGFLWMDPGETTASQQTLDVIADVVRRYDVDGAHIDDYFYPYPVAAAAALDAQPAADAGAPAPDANAPKPEAEFPDEPSWQAYVGAGGTLSRANWRRQNVNDLIERIYAVVHREKSWVKFGISPFGIGRPDRRPVGIAGFSQYDKLYADVELWLAKGWLDYLVPQLYWQIEKKEQAFGTLLDYWLRENGRGRHVWPGLYTSRINDTPRSWQPEELLGQVTMARTHDDVRGQVHFSMVSLLQNRKGITDRLKAGPYATDAIVPAFPWIDGSAPPPPGSDLRPDASQGQLHLRLSPDPKKAVANYAVWARYGSEWRFFSVPAARPELDLATTPALDRIVVSALDRSGNESRRIRLSAPWPTVAKGAP